MANNATRFRGAPALSKQDEFQQALRSLISEDPTRGNKELVDELNRRLEDYLAQHYQGGRVTRADVRYGRRHALKQIQDALYTKDPKQDHWSHEELNRLTFLWGQRPSPEWLSRVQQFHANKALHLLFEPRLRTPVHWREVPAKLHQKRRQRGLESVADLSDNDIVSAIPENVAFLRRVKGLKTSKACDLIIQQVAEIPRNPSTTNWKDAKTRETFARSLMHRFGRVKDIPIQSVPKALIRFYGTQKRGKYVGALARLLSEFNLITPEQSTRLTAYRSHNRRRRILLQHLNPNAGQAKYRDLTGMAKGPISRTFVQMERELRAAFAEVQKGQRTLADVAREFGVGARGIQTLYKPFEQDGSLTLFSYRGTAKPEFREDMKTMGALNKDLEEHWHALGGRNQNGRRLAPGSQVSMPPQIRRLRTLLHKLRRAKELNARTVGRHVAEAQSMCERLTENGSAITIRQPRAKLVTERTIPGTRFTNLHHTLEAIRHEHRLWAA
ncbi:hypothetical protein HY572_05945 [Candidatus Micrarchaeota archaeon]|nr:hypothetical protein [Candidatus Micrarchaeota archaeon]